MTLKRLKMSGAADAILGKGETPVGLSEGRKKPQRLEASFLSTDEMEETRGARPIKVPMSRPGPRR